MTPRRLAIAVIGLVAAVGMSGIAAAGAPAKAKPLTKQEWIRKADKICTAANKELRPLLEKHFGDLGKNQRPSDAALAAYVKDFIPVARKHFAKIKKLRPPTADVDTINELLDAEEAAINAIEDNPKLILAGNSPLDKVSELAQDYGLKVCGQGN